MSIDSVRRFFQQQAPDIRVREAAQSTATVDEAAAALGVLPCRIAKTLALHVGRPALVVIPGDARLDNAKCRALFGVKARMLDAGAVERLTGHPPGGVCPFGLPEPMPVYCDYALRAHGTVFPAAGAPNSFVELTPDRLAALAAGAWADLVRATAD
ncbi:YbaK/EbsC family protein [Parapedomonas caeni]|jgi:prolyl-tRNA editing enzyme YbaK/EbsC (Cys-tRNA(Pro) deacylase)